MTTIGKAKGGLARPPFLCAHHCASRAYHLRKVVKVREPEAAQVHILHFLFRSKWNVVGLLVGFALAYGIGWVVESVKLRIVLVALVFMASFFGFMAVGIRKECRGEDEGA